MPKMRKILDSYSEAEMNHYRCAICGRLRLEVNHWWLGYRGHGCWSFSNWDDGMAEQKETDKLCSLSCLTIWVNRRAEGERAKIHAAVAMSRL